MEEQTSVETVVEEVSTVEETSSGSDSFLEGWDEGETVADQPAEEEPANDTTDTADTTAQETTEVTTTTSANEDVTEQKSAETETPKTWKLKHLDSEKTVGEAEMQVLAQKGMDYDRIRAKYDESKPAMEMLTRFAQKANMTVDAYVEHLRVKEKEAAGLNKDVAKKEVDLENREAKLAETQEKQTSVQNHVANRKADIAAFQKKFPDVAKNPKSIPKEVFAQAESGIGLVAAYSLHLAKVAQAEAKEAKTTASALEQNQKNAQRSAGSMKTAGSTKRAKDAFLEGWGDD